MSKLTYGMRHWRVFIHLLLRTKRFGVNNQWWSYFDSMFGLPDQEIAKRILYIRPLLHEYKLIRARAVSLGFISDNSLKELGWYNMKYPWR